MPETQQSFSLMTKTLKSFDSIYSTFEPAQTHLILKLNFVVLCVLLIVQFETMRSAHAALSIVGICSLALLFLWWFSRMNTPADPLLRISEALRPFPGRAALVSGATTMGVSALAANYEWLVLALSVVVFLADAFLRWLNDSTKSEEEPHS